VRCTAYENYRCGAFRFRCHSSITVLRLHLSSNAYGNNQRGLHVAGPTTFHSDRANSGYEVPFISDDVVDFTRCSAAGTASGRSIRHRAELPGRWNYWKEYGLPPDNSQIAGWISVNADRPNAKRRYGCLRICILHPAAAGLIDTMQELQDGFVWEAEGRAIR
jgi:hypothetical protein